jgi:hypothetical protein
VERKRSPAVDPPQDETAKDRKGCVKRWHGCHGIGGKTRSDIRDSQVIEVDVEMGQLGDQMKDIGGHPGRDSGHDKVKSDSDYGYQIERDLIGIKIFGFIQPDEKANE